jgi:hypothetical protein
MTLPSGLTAATQATDPGPEAAITLHYDEGGQLRGAEFPAGLDATGDPVRVVISVPGDVARVFVAAVGAATPHFWPELVEAIQ